MASPDAELKVRINAELGDFEAAIRKGTTALKDFDSAAVFANLNKSLNVAEANAKLFGNQLSSDVSKIASYRSAINQLVSGGYTPASKEVVNLANKVKLLEGSLGKGLTAGSNQAAFALTNLGRVAQDAPFGFIGIQNNLNPLLESFQRLKAESGSTGGALKALAGSLAGPAGLGVALSLVTAGLLLYQTYLQKTAKDTKEVADANEALAKSTADEIAKVTVLYDASQNLNIPLAQRKKIVDELQKQFPATFGNLTDETILAGKAQAAYEGLTQSLINAAVVRGGQELIADKVKELASVLLNSKIEGIKLVEKFGKGLNAAQKEVLGGSSGFIYDTQNKDLQSLTDYETAIKAKIKTVQDAVQSIISVFSAESIIGNNKGGDKVTKPIKDVKTAVVETRQEVEELGNAFGTALNLSRNIWGQVKVDFTTNIEEPFKNLPKVVAKSVTQSAQTAKGILTPFQSILVDIIPQVKSGFENFFNDILEKGAFSFAALGQAILKTFTSVLASQAATSLLNLVASAANIGGSTVGGGGVAKNVAGAAGSALPLLAGGAALSGGTLPLILGGIAAAGLIASIFKKKKSDPYLQPAVVATSSASNVGSADFNSGRVVFEISGTNLVGVLNRAGQRLQRYNIV